MFRKKEEVHVFLKAHYERSSNPWLYQLHQAVILREAQRGHILTVAKLLKKKPNQRKPYDLVRTGLLDAKHLQKVDLSQRQKDYLTSEAVILALVRGIQPDLEALSLVPDNAFSLRAYALFFKYLEPETKVAMLNSNLFVNIADKKGKTPLQEAAMTGNVEGMRSLLAIGAKASINWSDRRGLTALHYAADHENSIETVSLLLKAGANPHLLDKDGKSILHRVAFHGCTHTAKVLLAAGARPQVLDQDGLTPLNVAANQKHHEVVLLLLTAQVKKRLQHGQWLFKSFVQGFYGLDLGPRRLRALSGTLLK